MGVGHRRVIQRRGHHGPPDQFPGKGGGGSCGPFRGGIQCRRAERDQAAVEFQQPDPLGMGQQRDLHREVHPPGTLRQRPLQHVRPVGGEHKCDVGVVVLANTFVLSEELKTIPLGLQNYIGAMGKTDWTATFAAVCVTITPLLLVFLVLNKAMIQGLESGATKG